MKYIVAVTVAIVMLAAGAEAKSCKKGKPCGNSCIAVTKTCRK